MVAGSDKHQRPCWSAASDGTTLGISPGSSFSYGSLALILKRLSLMHWQVTRCADQLSCLRVPSQALRALN